MAQAGGQQANEVAWTRSVVLVRGLKALICFTGKTW